MDSKKWYASKTLWTGLTGFVGGLGAWAQTGDINALGTSVMGLLMIGLRFVTKQPLE